VLQQVAVSVDIFNRRSAVWDVVAEGAVAVRERLVKGCGVGRVIFTEIALAIAFPKIAARAHAPTVILLALLRCPDVRVEGTILLLGDGYEVNLGRILRVTKWKVTLVVIDFLRFFHLKPPVFEWFPNRRLHEKRA
jgi:hypothetical protein